MLSKSVGSTQTMNVAEAETIVSAIFPGTSADEKKTLVELLVEHDWVLFSLDRASFKLLMFL